MRNPDKEPVSLLLRGIMALSRRLRSERPPGALSLSSLGILGTLQRQGTLLASELAAAERLQPQSLTRLLAELEQDDLIERSRSLTDRRATQISITATGRQVLIADMSARRAWLNGAMSVALTTTERDALLAASLLMLKVAGHEAKTPESGSS